MTDVEYEYRVTALRQGADTRQTISGYNNTTGTFRSAKAARRFAAQHARYFLNRAGYADYQIERRPLGDWEAVND